MIITAMRILIKWFCFVCFVFVCLFVSSVHEHSGQVVGFLSSGSPFQ